MFPEFAALLFAARDFGHRAHLRTDTHAKHVILQEFYEAITELADLLIECYQGIEGVIDLPYLTVPVPTTDPLPEITRQHKVIMQTRDKAIGDIRPLNNIVDEIEDTYLQTIYKLTNLE